MVVNKRKKISRQRGQRWHGWGRGAAHHKGAGNRGGRGRAGSGKRADQKKPSYQKEGKGYLGRVGFTSKSSKKVYALNIRDIDATIEKLVTQKLVTKKADTYIVDLEKLGYNKLLGTGLIKNKYEITTRYASAGAIEKVKASGGNVVLTAEPVNEKPAAKKAEKAK